MSIIKKQSVKIHTLKSKLKISDEDYRLMLSDYWVSTSKDMSFDDAEALIGKLEGKAIASGVWSRYSARGKLRYEHLGERTGMATPAQLRKIEAMWKDVSYKHNPEKRQRALRKLIFRIVGVSDMSFIESGHVNKLIKTMQSMKHGRYK
ncbi:MAG TPA: DUF1018 domain-containing protein [Nitrospirae bacterium]|nr:DUF1018 domain-containing protein [Nitrospirota bacterium]HDH51252.1 DUF1018 domain-containing protein [Nitrospirota bacterium]HDK81033.1 DUF1018 domain-containing protein [Nitrospirota bacterium]